MQQSSKENSKLRATKALGIQESTIYVNQASKLKL